MTNVIMAFRRHPAHGLRPLPQRLLADWRGVSQAQVSRLEKRENRIDSLAALTAWADALLMPVELRWWPPYTAGVSSFAAVPSTVEPESDPEGGDVDRRDLFKLAGVVIASDSLGLAPWDRLAVAMRDPTALDESALFAFEKKTSGFFAREELLPGRELVADLADYSHTITRLLSAQLAEGARRRLLSVKGETEALLGWVYFDTGKNGVALKHYSAARRAADQAGDGPLIACVLGYMSYMADSQGDPEEALRMLVEAQHYVRGLRSAGTLSWLAAREAEVTAIVGQASETDRALERSFVAYDHAQQEHDRSWNSFFTASRMGSMAVSAYVRLRHPSLEQTAASVLGSLTAGENKVRAIVYADLARAAVAMGDFPRATTLVNEALNSAGKTETSIALQHLATLAAEIPADTLDPRAKELRATIAQND